MNRMENLVGALFAEKQPIFIAELREFQFVVINVNR